MKSICAFCHERYGDDNLHRCHTCNSEYCFNDQCRDEHEYRCAQLSDTYQNLSVETNGSFRVDIEPVEWFEEVKAGRHFHCPNCKKKLCIKRPKRMSWLMARAGYYRLKRMFSRFTHYQLRSDGREYRGFCKFCGAMLEIYRWQGMVTITVIPKGHCLIANQFTKTGRRPRMEIRCHS